MDNGIILPGPGGMRLTGAHCICMVRVNILPGDLQKECKNDLNDGLGIV